MYEDLTFEVILNRMLDRVPNTIDKREGSMIYNALAPEAAELKEAYIQMSTIMQETFADSAQDYSNLEKRGAERGLSPDPASRAILQGEFKNSSGSYMDVPLNSLFTLGELTYSTTEKISTGIFKIECQTPGQIGSSELGQLIPAQYIANLATAEATAVLTPGEDKEPKEEFRSRYLNALQGEAFGGNVVDYKQKTIVLDGVGGLRVYPVWNGGGTVKVVIINSEYNEPSASLIEDVQTALDPVVNAGKGLGIAPIGHTVTVEGATPVTIDIDTTITFQDGFTWPDIESDAIAAIENYFLELKEEWSDTTSNEAGDDELPIVVRISQIEVRLLDLTGVIDITGTTINTLAQNKTLQTDEIPELGSITA